jgi:hypothetical protein
VIRAGREIPMDSVLDLVGTLKVPHALEDCGANTEFDG